MHKMFNPGPGEIVRVNKSEYRSKDGIFLPKNYDDFYALIKLGYKLAKDPSVESYSQHSYKRTTDEEVIMNARKAKEKISESLEVRKEKVKKEAYDEYFKTMQDKIKSGELEGYPVNANEEAESYAQDKVMKFESEYKKFKKEGDNVAKGDKTIEDVENEMDEQGVEEDTEEESTEEESKEEKKEDEDTKKKEDKVEVESSVDVEDETK